MAMHFRFSKNKKPSQCSPKASHSGKNHQKSFHPSKSLQTPPNLSKPSKSPKIFPHLSKSPKITRNFPKTQTPAPATPKPPPEPTRTPPNWPPPAPNPPKHFPNPKKSSNSANFGPKSDTAFGKFQHRFRQIRNQSGTSREPVGKIRAPPQKAQKCWFLQGFGTFLVDFWQKPCKTCQIRPKKCQIPAKTSIFVPFGAVHGFSRLVPDWFPTGSRLVPNLPKAVSDFNFLGVKKTRCFGLKPAETRPNPSQSLGFLVIFPLDWHFERG